jgi:hypothetical protein
MTKDQGSAQILCGARSGLRKADGTMISSGLRHSGLLATAVGAIASCSAQTLPVGSNHAGPTPGVGDDASAFRAPVDASGGALNPDVADPCGSIEQESLAIRERSCAACHGSSPGLGAFNYVLDDAKLVVSSSHSYTNDAGMFKRLVVPGDPENSWVYQRIAASTYPTKMPPSNASQLIGSAARATFVALNASDISVLYEWILSCLGVDGRAARAAVEGGNDSPAFSDGGPDGSSGDDGGPVGRPR